MPSRFWTHVGRTTARAAIAAAVTAIVLAMVAPASHATETTTDVPITACGQVVTSNAILTKNLVCSGDGVIIDADGVTVDLGGHALRSSNGSGRGVVIDGPLGSTATVRGPGRIAGFLTGIDALRRDDEARPARTATTSTDRHHVVVDDVSLVDNSWGIQIVESTLHVSNSTLRGTNGIGGSECVGNCPRVGQIDVESTSIRSSAIALSIGTFGTFHAQGARIRGGGVALSTNAGFTAEDSTLERVAITCSESFLDIERSRLVDTTANLSLCDGATYRDNTIRSSGGGTALRLDNMQFGGPFIERNRFSGWEDAIVVGPFVDGLQITDNHFESNGTGVRSTPCFSNCSKTSARAVLASTSVVAAQGDGNFIDGNVFSRNTGNGVIVDFGTWTIGNNKATYNGGLGIKAQGSQLQVTDGGGNIAFGNLEPQCIGVVCAPSRK